MLTLYADESHDAHTYALGGWLVTPTHYELFEDVWKRMRKTVIMPDGSECPAFHASQIMNQRSSFKGWDKERAWDAFDKATEVVVHKPGRFAMWPCAVATEIPKALKGSDRDGVWLILFMKFFGVVLKELPAAQGISFVFDRKSEIEEAANDAYGKVTRAFADSHSKRVSRWHDIPRRCRISRRAGGGPSALRVAEAYYQSGWRGQTPTCLGNGFKRIRDARPKGALVRYSIEEHLRELNTQLEPAEHVRRVLFGEEVGRD